MSFSAEQVRALGEPLNKDHVKERRQGGARLSYVEGWHAIAEANRIFGFDAWSRETVLIECVHQHERTVGEKKEPGWGVTYIARVRITVGGVVRDGCGAGHGIDRDLGQAHESGIKEAETDAMKRALMTFGNPFGLALYDKTRANVEDPIDIKRRLFASIRDAICEAGDVQAVEGIVSDRAHDIASLPKEGQEKISAAAKARKAELMEKAA